MAQNRALSALERARKIDIQDSLIELYIARRDALQSGSRDRAKDLGRRIDNLLEEKADIGKSPIMS